MSEVCVNRNYQKLWRPAMAWSYVAICVADFLVFPIGSAIFQATFFPSGPFVVWTPITLGSGGLYHLSMLTICGASAYGRSLEKVQALRNIMVPTETPVEPKVE